MKLTSTVYPDRLELVAQGRLDASWAEHFLETARRAVREGHHQLRLDASSLDYLSSAGMRSLLQTHRELQAVQGTFRIIRASEFVIQTLQMSGFDSLLSLEEKPVCEPSAEPGVSNSAALAPSFSIPGTELQVFSLVEEAAMEGANLGRWPVWTVINPSHCQELELGPEVLALGIGAPGQKSEVRERLGDFLSAAGCTAYLPGDGSEAPDFLVGSGQFVPRLQVAEALRATGEFSKLIRFQLSSGGGALRLEQILEAAFSSTGSRTIVACILAEIEGLVGMSWQRSPGLISATDKPSEFPAVREWLSFCGERVHGGDLGLVVAFATSEAPPQGISIPALPSRPEWRVHAHALVFPFRPLAKGPIDFRSTIQQVFAGAAPKALLHLVEDDRAALGLGHSAFLRGACWCAPLNFRPELLT